MIEKKETSYQTI